MTRNELISLLELEIGPDLEIVGVETTAPGLVTVVVDSRFWADRVEAAVEDLFRRGSLPLGLWVLTRVS